MLHELFDHAKKEIAFFFENIAMEEVERLLYHALACEGILFLSGVGKSGLIASKIAATMTSTGTPSLFVSPTDALHGDIGMVTPKDLFILFSKSGETEELLHLIPFIRNKGAKVCAIVSETKSRLVKACDVAVTLPFENELCPFDLAPTTSTIIQLIFGDVVAMALMRKKKFSMDDYALNHPAGQIGKRCTLKVSDLMIQGQALPLCSAETTLGEALPEMSQKKCGCLMVHDHNKVLLGIFTDGDLRRALEKFNGDLLGQKMGDLMSPLPRSIEPGSYAFQALRKMEEDQRRPITHLPVVEKGKILGLIKLHDLIQSGV